MESWKRTVFFWTLALLFLITVPIVILSARGYRFDANRGVFVYSGTITFKANPQTVEVRLNDKLIQSKKLNRINNSYNIPSLMPGEYDIRISAEGFQAWSKKTKVRSGMASEFWNVILARNNYEKTDLNIPGIKKFFTSPKNNFFAYVSILDQDLAVRIFDIESGEIKSETVFPDRQFIEDSRKENLEWSPDEVFISIPVENNSEYGYFIYDLENKNQIDLNNSLNKKNIRNVRWDPKEKGYLFFIEEDNLFRVNTKNFQELTLVASDISSYDLSGALVYYSKNSNLLFKNNLNGKAEPSQITSNFPGPENLKIATIIVYDDSRIALISESKDFYIFNKGDHGNYFRKLAENIQGSHFSDDGKKLLFWSDNEISIYFLRDQLSQPIREENEMQNITRHSEPIKNIQWLKNYEHVIFSSGRWIKIIEVDLRDRTNCMDIANTETETPFVIYNNSLEKLYFTDTKNDTTSLYSIDFPEEAPLLGVIGLGQ